ncbi:unnamed protein product [Arctia plantaginis]|uniref:Uncharacterized protein n=1 Tax=Arctia plantaginis TaxID=874455 RepID=A0A8S0Z1Z4_ARCPL|nr:unnamed protein product [Arctia plantaginis]
MGALGTGPVCPCPYGKDVPAQLPRALPAASATRNHGGDYRGDLRERGHPQGGPHQPQDRGGEDRHTTVLCNDARATQI